VEQFTKNMTLVTAKVWLLLLPKFGSCYCQSLALVDCYSVTLVIAKIWLLLLPKLGSCIAEVWLLLLPKLGSCYLPKLDSF
jgi:hypothetical protein